MDLAGAFVPFIVPCRRLPAPIRVLLYNPTELFSSLPFPRRSPATQSPVLLVACAKPTFMQITVTLFHRIPRNLARDSWPFLLKRTIPSFGSRLSVCLSVGS